MKTLEEIEILLEEKLGRDRFVFVSTAKYDLTTNPKGRNSKKGRSDWADVVVKMLFENKERGEIVKASRRLGTGEYNFAYIKFAVNDNNEIFGVVHGKSSFHCMYPSDVWFYDLNEFYKKEIKEFFENNGLRWYTERILIIKNLDVYDYKESYINEKHLKEWFHTFD